MNRIRQFELEGGVSRSKVSAFDGQEDTDSDWQSIPMRNLENMWSYNVLAGLDTTEAQHIQHRCCDLISANSISPTKAERKCVYACRQLCFVVGGFSQIILEVAEWHALSFFWLISSFWLSQKNLLSEQ